MHQILKESAEIDVALLDSIVSTVYQASANSNMRAIQEAQDVLSELKRMENSWKQVDQILEKSECPTTHFFALQMLDEVITTKWNQFSADDRLSMKKFLWNYILAMASQSDPAKSKQLKPTLNKANCVLVHVLKYEWPEDWPDFMEDLFKPLKDPNMQSGLFENTFGICKLLSEEVFNYDGATMTSRQATRKKEALLKEYALIINVGVAALKACNNVRVAHSALQMLEKYLNWIPSEKVHESEIIEILGGKYLSVVVTRNQTIKCFTEIASQEARTNIEKQSMAHMYRGIMSYFTSQYSLDTDFNEHYTRGTSEEADFLYNVAFFLISIFQYNLPVLEENIEESSCGHLYLSQFTKVKNKELFKACNEYWLIFCSELCSNELFIQQKTLGNTTRQDPDPRADAYSKVLCEVRQTLALNMAKPEEIIIVEDEQGEFQKEYMTDVETIDLYQTMRQTLVLLTHLDVQNMEEILTASLKKQSRAVEEEFSSAGAVTFNWSEMNTLCWAIGSISGSMTESDERSFFIMVIRELLEMCERARGKENKAVIASNIMYVVGQYPRFLRSHYRFLKTVENKLTEFMHETFPGVQDMAVDTFLKLARKCGSVLTEVEVEDDSLHPAYIYTYLDSLDEVLAVLTRPLTYVLYEALGIIVCQSIAENQDTGIISQLFELIDEKWSHIAHCLGETPTLIGDQEFLQELLYTLKCMTHAGRGLGPGFVHYMHRQLDSILVMYTTINEAFQQEAYQNTQVERPNQHTIKQFRSVKKEILKTLGEVFSGTNNPEGISIQILPYVFNTILPDYGQAQENFRDAQVLILLTLIVEKVRSNIKDSVEAICEYAIYPTLRMISRNMQDFPDLRSNIFKLMRALTRNCFGPFLRCAETSPLIVDGVLWATKHSASEISSAGVDILFDFLRQVMHSQLAECFYIAYFITIFTEIFAALTDTLHTADFIGHVRIITLLMQIAGTAKQIAADQDPSMKSLEYLHRFLQGTLANAYPNLNAVQIEQFSSSICALGVSLSEMLTLMRDFIIESKEWGPKEAKMLPSCAPTSAWAELPNTEELAATSTGKNKVRADKLSILPGFVLDKHETSYSRIQHDA
ncbi:Exportin-1 [Perkinsela sp. CCAP 1560/4]|nr:Exportin-1 [Perkinsela sp. CCAP 1560/4]|eukprot:KNH08615.1 Exportin-1 [Perkinsela sp. CCAP 1560/4]